VNFGDGDNGGIWEYERSEVYLETPPGAVESTGRRARQEPEPVAAAFEDVEKKSEAELLAEQKAKEIETEEKRQAAAQELKERAEAARRLEREAAKEPPSAHCSWEPSPVMVRLLVPSSRSFVQYAYSFVSIQNDIRKVALAAPKRQIFDYLRTTVHFLVGFVFDLLLTYDLVFFREDRTRTTRMGALFHSTTAYSLPTRLARRLALPRVILSP
jgi:hypothetical protein